MTHKGRTIVSLNQAVALTGVTRRALYNWMNTGKIEYVKTAGGQRRIYEDTLWQDPIAPRGTYAGRPQHSDA